MVTLLSRTSTGVSDYSISTIEDLKKINKAEIAPTSCAKLVDNDELRIFILNGDKTKWLEL